jgi:hypothetical protein
LYFCRLWQPTRRRLAICLYSATHGDGDDAALVVDFAAVTTSGGNTGAKEIQFWGMPSQ